MGPVNPDGQTFFGAGPVGVVLGMDRHLPPMNLIGGRQKQLGGVPTRPPVHLPFDVGVVGDASGSHPPERVACVPGGQGLLPPLPDGFVVVVGRTHLPFWKLVPLGQQLG